MPKATEKLKDVTNELITEKEEVKVELNQINNETDKFSEEIQILPENERPRGSATAEIENILREAAPKPMHVREITDILHSRGFTIALQSVSGTLQIKTKKRDKFYKAAPATFGLLGFKNKPFAQDVQSAEESEEEVTFV